LKEADDPNVELIPHADVVLKLKMRRAEFMKKCQI